MVGSRPVARGELPTRALAESFRAELMAAARVGEPFDEVTGLPESRARDVPWFDHAVSYVDIKWPRAAAKSRKSTAEALTTVTMALRAGDCELPASGWGRLQLARSEPWAGQEWTDNGKARERRALKRRASSAVRIVPIPAELVSLLRTHLETFGTGDAGRVFHNERSGPFNEANARRTWARARASALTEEQVQSPLARRPYDLRHAAASLWLNNGVPATEVARRLGHDVAVLLKIYANCVDGQEDAINDQITAALAAGRDRETLAAAPAVDDAAQLTPRTRARAVGSGRGKLAGQPS